MFKPKFSTMHLYLLCAICCIASCSILESKPDNTVAFEKVKLKEFNALRSADILEVVKLEKTNGEELVILGQQVYRFHYSITAKFKCNAHSLFRNDLKYLITDTEIRDEAKHHRYTFDYDSYYHYKKGQSILVTGSIEMRKTENGWK